MIPKIVHQTWKTEEVTHWIFKKSQASVREWLSEWEYRFWTDAKLERFMREAYPEHFEAWANLDRTIKRVDLSRYLILHRHGGLYADLDWVFTGDVGELIEEEIALYFYQSKQALVKGWDFLGNAFMMSTPGQDFWLEVVDYMLGLPANTPVLRHTGPRALGAYWEGLSHKPNATIFGPDIFDNEKCADGVGKRQYGYHVRTATWQHSNR